MGGFSEFYCFMLAPKASLIDVHYKVYMCCDDKAELIEIRNYSYLCIKYCPHLLISVMCNKSWYLVS